MKKINIYEQVRYLFNRRWDEELTDEQDEKLQNEYDILINEYSWKVVFDSIDNYMRSECIDGESVCNFAHLYWGYNCYEPKKIESHYRFLGYIYYRMDLNPWKYDAVDLLDGIVNDLLSTPDDKSHNPFWNPDYIPEKDPEIIAEVERLRKEKA